jgi:tungstate transport system substrate-binding protein
MRNLALLIFCVLSLAAPAKAADTIILQSTTSTQNSGLLDAILPQFTDETGIVVRVVAVGTGQALKNARNGDGDVLLVHARELEDAFVKDGWGINRKDLMYNDFVLIGPSADPAGISAAANAVEAVLAIAQSHSIFVSRGDSSGTHVKELSLWTAAAFDPAPVSGDWYLEAGAGMGTTINIAVEEQGYTLTDRGTWIAFGNKKDHTILFEGDKQLFNPYGIMLVNPARHPHVKAGQGQALIDWMTGPTGQAAIAQFTLDGQQLFFPDSAN